MKESAYITHLLIMAITTYLIRVVPFIIFKKEIQNAYLKSFLEYIPYAVLASMTIPSILYSTDYMIAAAIGLIVAIILSYYKQSMVRVAVIACFVVFLVESIIRNL